MASYITRREASEFSPTTHMHTLRDAPPIRYTILRVPALYIIVILFCITKFTSFVKHLLQAVLALQAGGVQQTSYAAFAPTFWIQFIYLQSTYIYLCRCQCSISIQHATHFNKVHYTLQVMVSHPKVHLNRLKPNQILHDTNQTQTPRQDPHAPAHD